MGSSKSVLETSQKEINCYIIVFIAEINNKSSGDNLEVPIINKHTPLSVQLVLPSSQMSLLPETMKASEPRGSADSIGYPCTKASGESSTTKHRILHASGPHPIPSPDDPN
ncbi:hypothetical protein F511_09078 [Dorcoceras hygrometricum]|uniref:Uncharacterized protein n=1 Tax=Dorcoceras hygrometricum TaxID=472368 RepID=A0A2Z7D9N9_9LAMI|nr:hypothetical protein F511_09078 [Dorcoceras hygrometricum]